ncbi:MAG: HAMP domain-containing protein, partial [Rickettsiales bacterium]|nr:HAMP domain-containing protein [Rickettsiales bacterium]
MSQNALSKLTIPSKIGISFGFIIVMVTVLAVLSYVKISKIESTFNSYERLAKESIMIGLLFEDLGEAKISAFKYRIKGGNEHYDGVLSNIKEITDARKDIDAMVMTDGHKEKLIQLEGRTVDYLNIFKQSSVLQEEANALEARFHEIGPKIRADLTSVMESERANASLSAAYDAANIQQHLILSRLYVSKFLAENSQDAAVRANEEFAKALSQLSAIQTKVRLSKNRQTVRSIIAGLNEYKDTFAKIETIIAERNELNLNRLDIMGPEILTGYDTLYAELQEQQRILGLEARSQLESISNISIMVGLIIVVIASMLAYFMCRFIKVNFTKITSQMNRLSNGENDFDIEGIDREDDIGDMAKALDVFRNNSIQVERAAIEKKAQEEKQKAEQERLLAEQEQRIMDDVSEVIKACGKGDFTHRIDVNNKEGLSRFLAEGMNEICDVTFSSISDIRHAISDLSLGKLDIKIDRHYHGIFDDIKNDFNNTLTQIETLINDVNKSVSLATKGNFEYVIDTKNSSGFMLELAKGMNDICHVSHQGLSEVKQSIVALSNGDLTQHIEGSYEGEFLEIKTSFNNTLDQLSVIMNDIKHNVSQISEGDFSNSISTDNKDGFLLELAVGINSINTVLDKGLGEFKHSVEALSKGNLNQPIKGDYAGKFDEIKVAVNVTLDQLSTVMEEIKASTNAISRGDFTTRLAIQNKEGFLLDLSQSINDISDVSNSGLTEIGNVLKALSEGDLDKEIVNQYHGTFQEIKELVNGTISNLQQVVGEIQNSANAVKDGDFTVHIDTEGKKGFMLDLSDSLNEIGVTSSTGLNEIGNVLKSLSNGSLMDQMEGNYKGTLNDIKKTLNTTIAQLREMVLKIVHAANSVNAASTEISDGSKDLSHRTEVQASTLEETTAATEQLSLMVKNNTSSAQDANSKAGEARSIATLGEEIVSNAVNAMSSIQESSSKVTDIIGVIDEIAFQTNLLA